MKRIALAIALALVAFVPVVKAEKLPSCLDPSFHSSADGHYIIGCLVTDIDQEDWRP